MPDYLDDPLTVWQEIDTPAVDLAEDQAVCEPCRYVFMPALGFCPECEPDRALTHYRARTDEARLAEDALVRR